MMINERECKSKMDSIMLEILNPFKSELGASFVHAE